MPENGKLKGPPPEGRANHAPQVPALGSSSFLVLPFPGSYAAHANRLHDRSLSQYLCQGPLKDAADRAGIVFSGKADRYPNTVKAHTLMQFAEREAGRETQNTLMEVLFRQYFTDGLYPDEASLQVAFIEASLSHSSLTSTAA